MCTAAQTSHISNILSSLRKAGPMPRCPRSQSDRCAPGQRCCDFCRIAIERPLRPVLCQQDLCDVNVTLEKSPFTPGQVELPHPLEASVKSEVLDLLEIVKEAFPPTGERVCVVQSEIFHLYK